TVMVGQAIPSVAPQAAAGHLNKIECFCFEEQVLEAGETADMPIRFFVDPELPANISKLTLSYTLYDITDKSNKGQAVAIRESRIIFLFLEIKRWPARARTASITYRNRPSSHSLHQWVCSSWSSVLAVS